MELLHNQTEIKYQANYAEMKMRQKLSSVLTSDVRWRMGYRFYVRPLTLLPFSQLAPTLSIVDAEATLDANYRVQEIPSLKYWMEP
jgi:hypothetical protein